MKYITFTVPCYNSAPYMERCINSLLTFKNEVEIIIVDDGSTDECSLCVLKDMEKKSDLPIPVMIHYQENGGVSAARNAGIKKTEAPMVLVLDGDDKLKPEYKFIFIPKLLSGDTYSPPGHL